MACLSSLASSCLFKLVSLMQFSIPGSLPYSLAPQDASDSSYPFLVPITDPVTSYNGIWKPTFGGSGRERGKGQRVLWLLLQWLLISCNSNAWEDQCPGACRISGWWGPVPPIQSFPLSPYMVEGASEFLGALAVTVCFWNPDWGHEKGQAQMQKSWNQVAVHTDNTVP